MIEHGLVGRPPLLDLGGQGFGLMRGQPLPSCPSIDSLAISRKLPRFHPLVSRSYQGRYLDQERAHKGVLVRGKAKAGLKPQHAGSIPDINRLSERLARKGPFFCVSFRTRR